jgi:hypothetical protein
MRKIHVELVSDRRTPAVGRAKPSGGVARQKWPREILLEVADYPRTVSGKVQQRLVRGGIAVTSA